VQRGLNDRILFRGQCAHTRSIHNLAARIQAMRQPFGAL
jgi:hypothetical protein